MHIIYFDQHQQQSLDPDNVPDLLQGDKGVLWIDVDISNERDLAFLNETFAPHPITLDNLQQHQLRPKAEEFADYLFVTLNPVNALSIESMFRKLGIFIGRNYVITAHLGEEPLVGEMRKRLQLAHITVATSAYVLYIIFDTVLDDYLPVLEQIEERIGDLGGQALQQPQPDILNHIFDFQRSVNQFWWVLWPQQDIISIISNYDLLLNDEKSLHYVRDISDHLTRILGSLQNNRDTLTSLIQIYISSVSNRLNSSVQRLTMLTIGVGIIAVFAGFYGMNFEQTWPPFDAPWGVPVVLVMMFTTVLLALAWLGRSR